MAKEWDVMLEALRDFTKDFMAGGRDQPEDQERDFGRFGAPDGEGSSPAA